MEHVISCPIDTTIEIIKVLDKFLPKLIPLKTSRYASNRGGAGIHCGGQAKTSDGSFNEVDRLHKKGTIIINAPIVKTT
jgi:hypothetical protein